MEPLDSQLIIDIFRGPYGGIEIRVAPEKLSLDSGLPVVPANLLIRGMGDGTGASNRYTMRWRGFPVELDIPDERHWPPIDFMGFTLVCEVVPVLLDG